MVLVRDEPVASVIQEAPEGFASGRFRIQAEVMRFLNNHPDFPKRPGVGVTNQQVKVLLSRVLYAGYVESLDWDVPLRKGRHDGLVTLETFELVQQRIKDGGYAPARVTEVVELVPWPPHMRFD